MFQARLNLAASARGQRCDFELVHASLPRLQLRFRLGPAAKLLDRPVVLRTKAIMESPGQLPVIGEPYRQRNLSSSDDRCDQEPLRI